MLKQREIIWPSLKTEQGPRYLISKLMFPFWFFSFALFCSARFWFSWFSAFPFVAKYPDVCLMYLVSPKWLTLQRYSYLGSSLLRRMLRYSVIFEIFIGSRHILKSMPVNRDNMSFLCCQKTPTKASNVLTFSINFFVTHCVVVIMSVWHICFPLPLRVFHFLFQFCTASIKSPQIFSKVGLANGRCVPQ